MAICPICQSEVAALDKVGDAEGFDCPTHGKFKVSSSVFVDTECNDANREKWETVLTRAKQKAKPGEWPLIRTYDF
jgi:hypothetical protein